MREILTKLIPQLGTLASLLGLIFTISDNDESFTGWQWLLIFLSISFFALSIYITISDYYRKKPSLFKSPEAVKNYMYKLIENSGRTAIFSRSLSWVDDKTKTMLINKAKKDQLIICIPKKIATADELEKNGAHIIIYDQFKHLPESRFTISNFGRADAKVAVGEILSTTDYQHRIQEYKNGNHPYFHIADDLIKLLMSS